MAFQQGLSGLNSSSRAIDVISNNIANASVVGFKGASSHFADVFAASLSGSNGSFGGIGARVATESQQFTQGNITTTNNPLDIAINGGGFFRMSDPAGIITYSRNGQFLVDKAGFVVNDQGLRLTGRLADSAGVIVPSTPGAIQIDTTDIPPVATGASIGQSGVKGVQGKLNLDSRVDLPTALLSTPNDPTTFDITRFDPDNPNSYNFSTATTVFDARGNPHTMTMFFVKTPNAGAANGGQWDVFTTLDGTSPANITANGAAQPFTIDFQTNGDLSGFTPPALTIDLAAVEAATGQSFGAGTTQTFDFDLSGTTSFGSSFGVNSLLQDGFASGRLASVSVGQDGVIQGRYTNGQTQNLAQVVLANFTSPNGLQPLGANQWAETADSGPGLIGVPGSASLGVLQSAAVEESNVDLTAELVAMITQQRNYQANAQSIKTQDQILSTLVNLR